MHDTQRRFVAALEVDGPEHGFQRIGEDGRALGAAAARFTFGQAQHLGQAERERGTVQAVFAHEVGAHAREVTFVAVAEAVIEQARDGEVQHRIAEKLEPLVVRGAEAAVRERALQQRLAVEDVAKPPLQGLQRGGCRSRHGGVGS